MANRRKDTQSATIKLPLWAVIGLPVVVLILAVAFLLSRGSTSAETVEFPHMHGLGFSADGSSLYVPAHIGLMVYSNGRWTSPDVPKHDYMGYASVDDGFYSSGHPDLRTDFEPLLGLVKSEDEGRTLNVLAFEGESDFHVMAAGYRNHTVYVINPSPNSRLATGMYYSLDDGVTWDQSQASGVNGSPIQLAVHPSEAATVALVTETGLYISNDYGNTFTHTGEATPVSAVAFAPDGETLLSGYRNLSALNLSSDETTILQTPSLGEDDAIAYIAVNPTTSEIAFATFNRNIFLSQGNRQSWQQIAEQGVGRS